MKQTFCATVLALATWAPLAGGAGSTATFDFDTGTPPVGPTQGMPATQSNNGLTASFTTLSGGWSIQNTFYGWVPSVFSGNFLYPSTWGSTFAVEFSEPVTSFKMAFATGDVSSEYDVPTTVRLTAYADSAMTTAIGSTTAKGAWISGAYPEGSVTLRLATPFTKVKVDMPPGQNPPVSYILFADNIVVTRATATACTITARAAPGRGGTVTGGGSYPTGSPVTVAAAPNAGYAFTKWTEHNATVSTASAYTFTASASRTLVAHFARAP